VLFIYVSHFSPIVNMILRTPFITICTAVTSRIRVSVVSKMLYQILKIPNVIFGLYTILVFVLTSGDRA
jgi:hypothetical protein